MGDTGEELKSLLRRLIVPACDEQLNLYPGLEGAKKAIMHMQLAKSTLTCRSLFSLPKSCLVFSNITGSICGQENRNPSHTTSGSISSECVGIGAKRP
ncbi:hypothetical protein SISSUDRAFT_219895 [Sistotremastrum suecicum HHB10207 ss-3]|uniref:Uncharacterized protein n=1 Tax=Sistotremastrum suecicum HHB10207 ss-3 TaxID=1314776 RepID=A0A166A4V5_9AGAM|nr:hypothetical protein SISSUDRAFT_219895 [Sistotremastrum suecicum HHB10207 ss-3]